MVKPELTQEMRRAVRQVMRDLGGGPSLPDFEVGLKAHCRRISVSYADGKLRVMLAYATEHEAKVRKAAVRPARAYAEANPTIVERINSEAAAGFAMAQAAYAEKHEARAKEIRTRKDTWFAYCYADGAIHYGPAVPGGALAISRSPSRAARDTWCSILESHAQLSTCGSYHSVPGITGDNQIHDVDALSDFALLVSAHMARVGWAES